MKAFLCSFLVAAALLVLAANPAAAAFINFTDTTDTINVAAGDFEQGITVNGQSATGLGNSVNVNVDESNSAPQVSFNGTWQDGDQSGGPGQSVPGTYKLLLVEANDPSMASDYLQYTITRADFNHATISGTFTSFFTNGTLASDPQFGGATPVVEDGIKSLDQPFLSIPVNSDVEGVPEPASIALVAGGLLTLAGRHLIRRKRKA
jgi:hypothetical protein